MIEYKDRNVLKHIELSPRYFTCLIGVKICRFLSNLLLLNYCSHTHFYNEIIERLNEHKVTNNVLLF